MLNLVYVLVSLVNMNCPKWITFVLGPIKASIERTRKFRNSPQTNEVNRIKRGYENSSIVSKAARISLSRE